MITTKKNFVIIKNKCFKTKTADKKVYLNTELMFYLINYDNTSFYEWFETIKLKI